LFASGSLWLARAAANTAKLRWSSCCVKRLCIMCVLSNQSRNLPFRMRRSLRSLMLRTLCESSESDSSAEKLVYRSLFDMRRFGASKLLSSTWFSLWVKKAWYASDRRYISRQAASALSGVPALVSSSGCLNRSTSQRAICSVGPFRSRS